MKKHRSQVFVDRKIESELDSDTASGQTVVNQSPDEDVGSDDETLPKETVNSVGESRKKVEEAPRLHPFVHWSQSQTHISLRVDLIQAENLNVSIADDGLVLKFSARGTGAHGLQDYHFKLNFYSQVEGDNFACHTIERYVLILLKKKLDQQQEGTKNWPRLTHGATKLAWLRVDFDRFADSDDSDTGNEADYNVDGFGRGDDDTRHGRQSFERLKKQVEEERQYQERTFNQQSPMNSWSSSLKKIFKYRDRENSYTFKQQDKRDLSNKMKYDYRKDAVTTDISKNTAKHALDIKKTYLFLYNLVMFIMFLKVCIVLLIKGLSGTIDDDIVQGAAFIIKCLTYTQLLETIHPMLGLVPGGPLMPFTQVLGRILVNIFLTEPQIRIDSAPYAHHLFIVWSSIEIFRYSFYALRVFKVNIYALTWCRYTLFLPLYPMGGLCESMVIMSTIKLYEKTGQYSIQLPNSANISFNLPIMLKVYTFLLLGPTIVYLMRYMWTQRCRQLKEKVA